MKTAGYTIRDVTEDDVTDAVAAMQRPAYRKGCPRGARRHEPQCGLPAACDLQEVVRDTLPVAKQKEIVDLGSTEKSPWVIVGPESRFVIPRYEVGNLPSCRTDARRNRERRREEAPSRHQDSVGTTLHGDVPVCASASDRCDREFRHTRHARVGSPGKERPSGP